jgi:hypothetical protein
VIRQDNSSALRAPQRGSIRSTSLALTASLD